MPAHPTSPPGAGRRDDVLQHLRTIDEPASIVDVAGRFGIHPNTARFHLEKLVNDGRAERVASGPGSPGRPRQLYRPIGGMDPMGHRDYRMLAAILVAGLAGQPDSAERSIEAGRAWAERRSVLAAGTEERIIDGSAAAEEGRIRKLVTMLDELGFAPERSTVAGSQRIDLRNCPFLELAADHPIVVCSLHLGLMRGAMESMDSTFSVDRLDAFLEPDLCVAHIGSRQLA